MLFQSNGICPICSSAGFLWCKTQDWEYRTTLSDYTYLKCKSCKTLFLNQLDLDRLADIYPFNYYSFTEDTNYLFRLKNKLDSKFYKPLLKKIPYPELSVLDVGGGTGQVLDVLRMADKRITYTEVVDIDSNARTAAEKKGHAYTCSTIESYQPNRKFDIILLLNIIEHVANPRMLIKKAGEMLTEKGIIVIKTPNASSLDANIFRNYYWGGLHCPRHWIIFNSNSFRLMLSEEPLQIQRIKYTQGAAFWAYSVINLFRKKNIALKKRPLIDSFLFKPLSIFFAVLDTCRSVIFPTSQMFIIVSK